MVTYFLHHSGKTKMTIGHKLLLFDNECHNEINVQMNCPLVHELEDNCVKDLVQSMLCSPFNRGSHCGLHLSDLLWSVVGLNPIKGSHCCLEQD